MKPKILLLTVVIISVNAYAINNLWRLNEDGDIIDGPTAYEGYYGIIKVSETGYIYTYDEYYLRCFDPDLDEVNAVSQTGGYVTLSIDNSRNEVVTDGTIKRFGPYLELLDEFDVPGYVDQVTVDVSDGAIWYTSDYPESGLYKVSYDGDLIYYFPECYDFMLTKVAPAGEFWVSRSGDYTGISLKDSTGNTIAEAPTVPGPYVDIYSGDLSCWVKSRWSTITKVNAAGNITYVNSTDFDRPNDLAVDQTDGSVWIADTYNYDIVHLDGNGGELLRTDWDEELIGIAVDPTNDTVVVISTPAHAAIEETSVGRIKAPFK
jgi:hypothetical protein